MYCFYFLHSFFGYFFSFVCICFLFVYSVCFSFFSICFVSVPPMAFPSHSKTQKKQFQNPKSKLQNPDQKARQTQKLGPERLKHLNPLLPLKVDEKIGLFAPCFFSCFSCHQSCVFFSVRFIGFTITSQNALKKNRESSP